MFTVASIVAAMALAACSQDPGQTDVSTSAYSASSQVPHIVAPNQVAEDLPGCFDLLTQPDWTMNGDVVLAAIGKNTHLGLLFIDGHQLCVDRLEELTTWVSTGRWPLQTATPYMEHANSNPDKRMGNHEFRQVSAVRANGSSNASDDDRRGDGVVDDGNPLPPYPRPVDLIR